jgi:hypothetical protein
MNVELRDFNLRLFHLSVLFVIFLSCFNAFYKNGNELVVLVYPKVKLVLLVPFLSLNQSSVESFSKFF